MNSHAGLGVKVRHLCRHIDAGANSFLESIRLSTLNVNTILAVAYAAEPREEAMNACVKEIP